MTVIPILVCANSIPRFDRNVSVDLQIDLTEIAGMRLEEVTASDDVIDSNVPFQVDTVPNGHKLTFMMTGHTMANDARHYRLRLDAQARVTRHPSPLVHLSETYHQGQSAYQIETPGGTWIFHRQGGGFASLLDSEGKDWISYRPHGGSDGKYRGIPNLKNPHDYFHPGAITGRSQVLSQGMVCCRIRSETLDGVCDAIWEIFPYHVTMKLMKGPETYWFLYEGTPGGKLNEGNGFIVQSDGTRLSARQSWNTVLDPGWLYFEAAGSNQVLFLTQHTTERYLSSYYPMESNMTVFGFGRKGLQDFLTRVPAKYSVGLLENGDFADVAVRIESIRQDLTVHVNGPVENDRE